MKKKIKLIKVGQGSSGYYGEDMLREFGPAAFPAGTKMLDTHINADPKGAARRGRGVSMGDVIARTLEEAYYDDGPDGPGLYAQVKFYDKVVEQWGEDRIVDSGFSIYTAAEFGETETIEGVRTRRVKRLVNTPITTIDAVAFAGAGGKVAQESGVKDGSGFVREAQLPFCDDGSCDGQPTGGVTLFITEAVTTAAKYSEVDMDLEQALARIKELEANGSTLSSTVDALNKELEAERTAAKEARENYAGLVQRNRELTGGMAVHEALRDVAFAGGDEGRELVAQKLYNGIKWLDDGNLDKEALAEAAKPYTDGTSSLVQQEAAKAPSNGYTPTWPSVKESRPASKEIDIAAFASKFKEETNVTL